MRAREAPVAGSERGFMMVALLISIAIMSVALTVALPAWSTMARREREAELVFRGEQYARAIALFQRKYAGAYPPNIDVLVTERFLRKRFKDPITDGDFQTIAVGQAVAGPQTANPLDQFGRAAAGRAGAATPAPARATGPGGTPQQTGARTGFSAGASTSPFVGQPGRGQPGGVGQVGASAGIMGVTSKSTDASLRLYKGGDHYNQWLFIGTLATTQAGGRGAQTPGQGVRGGQPPGARPGGPAGGRGGQPPTLPGTPFGMTPFGQPPAAPAPGTRR